MSAMRNQHARQYLLAASAAIAALILRSVLSPLLGTHVPYITVWAAVVFSSWYCGIGPSILTILISVLGVQYWFLSPVHSLALSDPKSDISAMVVFAVLSAFVIALGESNRRSNVKAQREIAARQRAEEDFRKARDELEQRVGERTRELQQKTIELAHQARLLDLANDAVFVRNADDKISYWNQGAERLYGWSSNEVLGRSTHEILRTEFPVPLAEILRSERWEGELLHTKKDGSKITVASRWTTLQGGNGKPVGWLEINTDITARRRAEEAARSLSGRILSLQDQERRRVARSLHDSLGQYLAALKINLDQLSTPEGNQHSLASECSAIVEKCVSETRTISHLLHPPLLDEVGFGSAAQWYVDGFAQRSGIKTALHLPTGAARLPGNVETALFRILQEALTNVHRHSGASQVDVQLSFNAERVLLEISDNGRGIPQDRLQSLLESGSATGVGLAGMWERVRELDGSLELQSNESGTALKVAVPIFESKHETGGRDRDPIRVVL